MTTSKIRGLVAKILALPDAERQELAPRVLKAVTCRLYQNSDTFRVVARRKACR